MPGSARVSLGAGLTDRVLRGIGTPEMTGDWPMRETGQNELMAWMHAVPAGFGCLTVAAPDLPPEVLIELLRRGWIAYTKDGRLVRTDRGHQVVAGE